MPGSAEYEGSAYFRPCPCHVATSDDFIAVASMGNLFAFDLDGRKLWAQEVPNKGPMTFTIPIAGVLASDAWGTLGLRPGSPAEEVKRAYRTMALATHPDRRPEDPGTAVKFREVQSAYERILAAPYEASVLGSLKVSFGMTVTVGGLTAAGDSILVSSSDGVLSQLDAVGKLLSRRVLGTSTPKVALREDGSLAATYCDSVLSFFEGDSVVNALEIAEFPRSLTMWAADLIAVERASLRVFNRAGELIWDIDFPKSVGGVSVRDDILICAAGALTLFERTGL